MPLDFDKIEVTSGARELRGLLSLLEDSVNAAFERARMEDEALEVGPEASDDYVDFLVDQMNDRAFTCYNYMLWTYGGFMVTAFSWFSDLAVRHTHPRQHSSHPVLMAKMFREEVPVEQEPSLWKILPEWLTETEGLMERLCQWNEVRNRFVHSFGVVADPKVRQTLTKVLAMEFDPDMHMVLSIDLCISLIEDAEAAALEIVRKTKPGE